MNAIDRLFSSDDSSSRAITAENMSDHLACELIQELDFGDWELDDWSAEFIESNFSRTTFSLKQKSVIYKLAKRFNLL